jgi:N-formylglutamate deformylase
MTTARPDWLIVEPRDAPLIVSIPHAGTELLGFQPAFVDPWLAREDADWLLDALYDFVASLGATLVRTPLSRSIIDVNRDPSGASLYPGQATTELVPTTTFSGEPFYRPGRTPDAAEIDERRRLYFAPYHAALASEIARLRQKYKRVALFDAYSIRSVIPRLFDGELPVFNLGTNSGGSCSPKLRNTIRAVLNASGRSTVNDGRFRGGWITRAYGRPSEGVEALQLELACRAYICTSPSVQGPTTGRRRSTKNARRRHARRSDAFSRRCSST